MFGDSCCLAFAEDIYDFVPSVETVTRQTPSSEPATCQAHNNQDLTYASDSNLPSTSKDYASMSVDLFTKFNLLLTSPTTE